MAMGKLSPGGQTYQASGESTPSAKLPEKFVSTQQPNSPLSNQVVTPTGYLTRSASAVVGRWPRMVGMRTLYQRGMQRMPIQRLGADGQPYPWDSNFQPNQQGPIRNGHFNDALYQAGYPGFNLGLSFKVPTLEQNTNPWTANKRRPPVYAPINIDATRQTATVKNATRR